MISASGEQKFTVMIESRQYVLDGKRMPDEWQATMLVPIFKGKDIRNCNAYRGVKLLEHVMKIAEKKDSRNSKYSLNAIRFYAWQKNNKPIVNCQENTEIKNIQVL